MVIPKKKYGLHCFACGQLFLNKYEVKRRYGNPYCEYCYDEFLIGIAEIDAYNYEMEKWHRNNPNTDYEQYQIDQANINKYGEC